MEGIWLALGFVCSSILAVTLIPSLPAPFAYTPLMLILGVIVLHRVSIAHGVVWLLLSGVLFLHGDNMPLHTMSYIAAAIVGAFFAARTFAKRSVYALLGLGTIVGGVFIATSWLGNAVTLFFGRDDVVRLSAHEAQSTFILLLVGLYAGFILSVALRRWFERIFYVAAGAR